MKRKLWNDGWTFWTDENPQPQDVQLPHDAMMHGRRDPASPAKDAMGYFCGDVYHYRKRFTAPSDADACHMELAFDGVMRNAAVLVNGREIARHAYGYTPFAVDLDGTLVPGGENTVEVVADNSQLPYSRWYTGGGIYRDVELLCGPKRHIARRGVRVTTLGLNPARIRVTTLLEGPAAESETVAVTILDDQSVVAEAEGTDIELEIPCAIPWSAERPHLYTCQVSLLANGNPADTATERFGIRTLSWSSHGLFVNGESVLLRGGCIHHDNGVIGAISCQEAEERRVRIMKEAGFNALRISHNPASTALIEACDRLGMYVMDETFDMWFQHKNAHDYASDFEENHLTDLQSMVERDLNHPSVIMYSIGNEVSEPCTPHGMDVARGMVELAHTLDPTRPVTAGINFMVLLMASKGKGLYDEGGAAKNYAEGNSGGKRKPAREKKSGSLMFNTMMSVLGKGINRMGNSKGADAATSPVLDLLDIAGYNYANGRYEKEGSVHPGRIIVGTETYPQDIADNWALVEKLDYLIGDFMWTGWDYLGEAAIGSWNYEGISMVNVRYPWLLSGAGVIDITGRPDAQAALAATVWNERDKPYIGVVPANHPGVRVTKAAWRGTNAIDSWSWSGCENNRTVVEVYARASKVQLSLNGKSLGTKRIKKFKATWRVAYEPGTLEAVAYDETGRELARAQLVSATGSPHIEIVPEVQQPTPGQMVYVPIELIGNNGVLESNADRELTVKVVGGELVGFGSAQPDPMGTYTAGSCRTWYGRALAVVRASSAGTLRISVRDEQGLTAQAELPIAQS